MSQKWFAPTPTKEPLQDAPGDTDSLAAIDARLIALAEQTARLTAEVKGRARAACCPRCGHYFSFVEADPEPVELDGTQQHKGEAG